MARDRDQASPKFHLPFQTPSLGAGTGGRSDAGPTRAPSLPFRPHVDTNRNAHSNRNCRADCHRDTHLAAQPVHDLAKGDLYPVGCLVGR